MSDTTKPITTVSDLTRIKRAFERVLGSLRYFQASAVALFVVAVSLVINYAVFLPADISRGMLDIFIETLISQPTSAAGWSTKFGVLSFLFAPLVNLLVAGAIANFERPISAIVATMVVALMLLFVALIFGMSELVGQLPVVFFAIHIVAIPINLAVLGLVVWGVLSLRKISSEDRDALRDGFGQAPLRTLFLRVFGVPGYTVLLGAQRWAIIPLFMFSSILLASSLYPFLFAGAVANTLLKINRAECIMPGIDRYNCFKTAMQLDAFLFPVYMGIAFAIPFALFVLTRRWARSLSIISMQRLMHADTRAPVLFLRPFEDDQVMLPKSQGFSLFNLIRIGNAPKYLEHQVLEELTQLGPVVAIGNRSKGKVPFGAAREYLPDTDWQTRVSGLIDNAQAIVIVLNETPGVWWEVNEILSRYRVKETLFILPPGNQERADRLLIGLCEALKFHGISPPDILLRGRKIAGLYLTDGGWQIGSTDQFTGTDTLILLRRFGAMRAVPRRYGFWLLTRYPFSIALLILLATPFAVSEALQRFATSTEVSLAPPGWKATTITGPGGPVVLEHAIYVEAVTAAPKGGEVLALMRNPNGAARLLTFTAPGALMRDQKLPVATPPPLFGNVSNRVFPFALTLTKSGGLRVAQTIRNDKTMRIETLELGPESQMLSHRISTPIPRLARATAGTFTPDGALLISGQVRLGTGRSPFIGKLGLNGGFDWSYANFKGFGWGNDVALSENGNAVFAVDAAVGWQVLNVTATGEVTFRADLPVERLDGAPSKVLAIGRERSLVLGAVSDSPKPLAESTPVLAILDASGNYRWATELPDLTGSYVKDLAYQNGRIYIATQSGVGEDATSSVTIFDEFGEVQEALNFTGDGPREIRKITLASDGALWVFGLAKSISPTLPPIERMAIPSEAWIIRLTRDAEG